MSGAGTPPAPSPSRTIYIDGRPRPPGALVWPNKNAADQLDFSIDYSGWLMDAFGGQAGAINVESINVAVTGDGKLTTVSQSLVGSALIFILSAGTPGQQYSFGVSVSTTTAPVLTATAAISLTINL